MNSQTENQPQPSEKPSGVSTELPPTGSSSASELTEAQIEATIKSALKLVSTGNFEEACSSLEETLKKAEKVYGESSFEAARLHFELGSALQQKAVTADDGAYEDIDESGDGKDEEEKEDKDAKEKENAEEDAENKEEDLEAAWEHLEVARVYMEKLLKAETVAESKSDEKQSEKNENIKISKALALVMLQLGDVNTFKQNFDAAIGDYEKGLELRKAIEDKRFSRGLAEIYFLLGTTQLYKNSDDHVDVALGQFNRARVILENVLFKEMGSAVSKDPEDLEAHTTFMSKEFLKPSVFETAKIKDLKEILEDLYQRIDGIKEKKKEIEARIEE